MKSLEQSGTRPWRTIWFNPLADLRRAAATWRRSSIPTRMSETSALGNSRQAPPGQAPINRGPRGGRKVLGQIWVACISRIEPQTTNSIFLESLSTKLLIIISTILFILASFSVPLDREKDFYCPEKLFQRSLWSWRQMFVIYSLRIITEIVKLYFSAPLPRHCQIHEAF